jgi:abhydrolase domain-containing protein 17
LIWPTRPADVKRIFLIFGVPLLLAYIALAVFGAFFSDGMMFQPPLPSYGILPGQLQLHTAGGKDLAAVWLPNPTARITILYFHGNACDLGQEYPFLQELQRHGFSVLAYDYPGYGQSGGRPTEQTLCEGADLAFHYLRDTLGVPPQRVIAYGRSLGGGPAVELASREQLGGLMLESTFISAFRVMTHWPLLPFDRFESLRKITQVHCPVLVMHGTADGLIPYFHGEALYARANEPKFFLRVYRAGHYQVPERGKGDYWRAVQQLADSVK